MEIQKNKCVATTFIYKSDFKIVFDNLGLALLFKAPQGSSTLYMCKVSFAEKYHLIFSTHNTFGRVISVSYEDFQDIEFYNFTGHSITATAPNDDTVELENIEPLA